METPPRFLYFDLGNVLLHFDHHRACGQMGQLCGLEPEVIWEIVFEGGLEWEYERGSITTREFYDRFCAASGTRPDCERLMRESSRIFELNVPLMPLVTALRQAGHRLGILSNTCAAHWEYVSRDGYPGMTALFDVFALSFQLGHMKPDPDVYVAAAGLAGVAMDEVFFVDDRPDHVLAAVASGMDAVDYTTPQALADALRARGVTCNY